jgi:hypothetical protein
LRFVRRVSILYRLTTKGNFRGRLLAGGEGGGVSPGVVDGGVVEVVSQVLEGALSGDDGLDVESEHGEHSESARGEGKSQYENSV